MSEKRFVYHEEYFPLNVREIIDTKIGKTYDCEDATDVLNELFNENEQLKEENEKLIQKKCFPCELVNLQTREIDKLKEENGQLNERVMVLEKLISLVMSEKQCSNCKYLNPIISLMGDYWCSKKDRFFCIDDLSNVCDSFTFDIISLTEKEDKVW